MVAELPEPVATSSPQAPRERSRSRDREQASIGTCATSCHEYDDIIHIALPGGDKTAASKKLLAARTAFFAPLVDEPGPADLGSPELEKLANVLTPGARPALLPLVELLGSKTPPRWVQFLKSWGAFNVFAAAHLLGAAEALDAVRVWAADAGEHQLAAAVSEVDVKTDRETLRMAVDYGLDQFSASKLIHAAAAADMADVAREMLSLGDADAESRVDLCDGAGRTPLHICAVHDSAAVAAVLLQASANLNALCDPADECENAGETANDTTPSTEDKQPKQTGEVSAARVPSGVRTPLHLAAIHDSAEVAQLLLDARANVAACVRGVFGAVTPLHECASADSVKVARVLAAAAAGVAAEPCPLIREAALCPSTTIPAGPAHTKKPTSVATAASDTDMSQVKETAVDDQRVSEVATTGASAVATRAHSDCSTIVGDTDMGGEECHREEHDAEGQGSSEMCAVRWSRFLDPLHAKCGPNSSTPLHVAAENDAAGVVAVLLDAKADPGLGDDQGDSALHCAMLYGSPRALAELLNHGASAMSVNGSGELPLHVMAEFGMGGTESDLPPALLRRHFARSDRARELLVSALRERGQLAAAVATEATVELQCTPLHAVARWDHLGAVHAVQLLAEARADLDRKNGEGRTALAIALRRYGQEGRVATLLRKLGAAEPVADTVDPLAKALGGCVRPLCPSEFAKQDSDVPAVVELPLSS